MNHKDAAPIITDGIIPASFLPHGARLLKIKMVASSLSAFFASVLSSTIVVASVLGYHCALLPGLYGCCRSLRLLNFQAAPSLAFVVPSRLDFLAVDALRDCLTSGRCRPRLSSCPLTRTLQPLPLFATDRFGPCCIAVAVSTTWTLTSTSRLWHRLPPLLLLGGVWPLSPLSSGGWGWGCYSPPHGFAGFSPPRLSRPHWLHLQCHP